MWDFHRINHVCLLGVGARLVFIKLHCLVSGGFPCQVILLCRPECIVWHLKRPNMGNAKGTKHFWNGHACVSIRACTYSIKSHWISGCYCKCLCAEHLVPRRPFLSIIPDCWTEFVTRCLKCPKRVLATRCFFFFVKAEQRLDSCEVTHNKMILCWILTW